MKKLVSAILALAMILALSTTALAATTQLTVDANRTYAGYKLLNVTTSLKTGEHPAECDGTNHVDGCYNYAYTVNPKYLTVLQTETGKTSEADILDYLAKLTGGEGTLRDAADDLYAAIVAAGLDADAENLTGTSTIDQGYWLFADVTDLNEENGANSLVIVDTAGQDALTIKAKTGLPTVEKKVLDKNDTAGTSAWQDSADHDINDDVSFKLTATLPENVANYDTYMIAFHDTLSAGLTLKPGTIKVTLYASVADAAAGTNGTDVTASFDIPNAASATFSISCDDVTEIANVTNDSVFVATYDATLNASANIGADGNPNEVYLEFSNNPYTNGTGKTETDKVTVFTYKVIINKVDGDDKPLKGAGFKLYKKNAQGTYDLIGTELKGNDMVEFVWNGLDDGDYKLEESTVPAGYNKMADIEFTITAEHSETAADPALTSLNGGNLAIGVVDTGIIEKDIENLSGTVLPETGAKGTFLLIAGGTLLVMMAAVFMVTRKKMSVYED